MRALLPTAPAALFAGLVLVSTPAAQGNVLSVGPFGGQQFTSIQAAVDAAGEGDVILIEPGFYPGPTVIDGKSVSLVKDFAPFALNVVFAESLTIRNLAADQEVLLHDIQFSGNPLGVGSSAAVSVENGVGKVLVEECICLGSPGLRVLNAENVFVARSTLQGRDGLTSQSVNFSPASGLTATDSELAVYNSVLGGGAGQPGLAGALQVLPGDGAPGILLARAELTISGSDVQGGDGAPGLVGQQGQCVDPGAGAAGLEVFKFTVIPSQATLIDTATQGGAEGLPAFGCAGLGADGPAIEDPFGTLVELPVSGLNSSYTQSSPVRGGEDTLLTLGADPGDVAFVAVATAQDHLVLASGDVLLAGPAPVVLALGAVPAGGFINQFTTAPLLPAGLDQLTLYTQGALMLPTGQVFLTEAQSLVIVNQLIP